MKNKAEKKRTKALVIGGSIAGMLAARVLADHFQEVVVMERDHYPASPLSRSGVPQDRQLHVLLLRGQNILRKLFPRLEEHLLKKGALQHDYGAQSLFYYRGRFSIKKALPGWLCSRLLLEWQIRQELIASYPQIHFLEGYEVVSLWGGGAQTLQGVKFRLQDRPNDVQELTADVVVDASGSSSRAPHWLKELGYDLPEETLVDASLAYATRYFRLPADKEVEWKLMVIQANGGRRSGSFMQLEDSNAVIVLAGVGGEFPDQKTDGGYLAFARNLPDATLYETIKNLEAITPIYGYRRTANRLRHYEHVILPDNFLVLGDAYCSFNPVYGQGMTVAALEALTLDKCLRRQSGTLSSQFHRSVARIVRMPWFLATSVDKGFLEKKKGATEEDSRRSLPHRYLNRVTMRLSKDSYVSLIFLKVQHMLLSPLAFLHPLVVVRVLFRRL